MPESHNNSSRRWESIEAHVAALDVEVTAIKDQVDALYTNVSRNHSAIMERLDGITAQQSQAGRLQPGWAAAVLGTVSLAGALLGTQFAAVRGKIEDHASQPGHTPSLVQQARLEERVLQHARAADAIMDRVNERDAMIREDVSDVAGLVQMLEARVRAIEAASAPFFRRPSTE